MLTFNNSSFDRLVDDMYTLANFDKLDPKSYKGDAKIYSKSYFEFRVIDGIKTLFAGKTREEITDIFSSSDVDDRK